MSHAPEATVDELAPTATEGYKVGQTKTVAELAELDKVVLKTLFLTSPTFPWPITLDLTQTPEELAKLKTSPVTIKEGIEYSVGITFEVENEIVSGLKYIQIVKRAGVKVDKTEAMLGSYAPQSSPYTKIFACEESPSGWFARSGTYFVQSRVIDDDNHVWADFEWGFKLAKEW